MKKYPHLSVRLDAKTKEVLTKDAQASGMTVSKFALYIINRYYQDKSK